MSEIGDFTAAMNRLLLAALDSEAFKAMFCDACKGSRVNFWNPSEPCEKCGGTGRRGGQ